MDPLGLALENFDAGMWRGRDRYAGAVIDASDSCRTARRERSRRRPERAAARPEQFVQTFTEGLLTYATGRQT